MSSEIQLDIFGDLPPGQPTIQRGARISAKPTDIPTVDHCVFVLGPGLSLNAAINFGPASDFYPLEKLDEKRPVVTCRLPVTPCRISTKGKNSIDIWVEPCPPNPPLHPDSQVAYWLVKVPRGWNVSAIAFLMRYPTAKAPRLEPYRKERDALIKTPVAMDSLKKIMNPKKIDCIFFGITDRQFRVIKND